MSKHIVNFIACLLLSTTAGACWLNTSSSRPRGRVIRDDLGRQVVLTRTPQRLVSLAPNVTEMLFALRLDDRVVGVTTYCDYPPAAATKPKIGDTIHPSLERILALKPDLVIASRVSQLESFARRLKGVGIPLYVVDARRLADVPRALRRLGGILGRSKRAQTVAQKLELRTLQIRQRLQASQRPKVLLVIQSDPLMVPGTRSYLADLVNQAGGELLGPDDAREGVTYSLESVIAHCPDVIILPESGAPVRRLDHVGGPNLTRLQSIGCGAVYSMNADLIFRPGPRLVEGLSELAHILHPEVFQP